MKQRRRVCVVVLGDLGHSPRMRNHALSLAKEGFQVDFIGYNYEGSQLPGDVLLNPNIKPVYMAHPPKFFNFLPSRLLYYAVKVLWQSWFLFFALPLIMGPDFILLQNPPSIPALAVCYAYGLVHRGTKLVLDWHNYGYTILALTLGPQHFLVKISKALEGFLGPKVFASFCVSKAMRHDLLVKWGVNSKVLYDRPPEAFRPISVEDKHRLFLRLESFSEGNSNTVFTEEFARGRVNLREDRPALLVSSTSWTEDEDFGVLLKALDDYETIVVSGNKDEFPHMLICVITGKGPLKSYYQGLIKAKKWQFIRVVTPWLEPNDYPLMLASADLGVCLHTSSSGLDLPMKVVDMFGCGLPVAAVEYPTLGELVCDGKNGMTFTNSEELADILTNWFRGFPGKTMKRYKRMSTSLEDFQYLRWNDYWLHTALPTFRQ